MSGKKYGLLVRKVTRMHGLRRSQFRVKVGDRKFSFIFEFEISLMMSQGETRNLLRNVQQFTTMQLCLSHPFLLFYFSQKPHSFQEKAFNKKHHRTTHSIVTKLFSLVYYYSYQCRDNIHAPLLNTEHKIMMSLRCFLKLSK